MDQNSHIPPSQRTWIMPPELFDKLAELYIFQDIDKSAIAEMFANPVFERFAAHTVIMREWDACNGKAYIVLDGSVEVQIEGKVVGTIEIGNIFGEYGIISEENRTATVVAKEDLLCMVLDQDTIFRLLNEGSAVNDVMVQRIKDNINNERSGFAD